MNGGIKSLGEKFLDKYWLPEYKYKNDWKPIQDKIFLQEKGLSELICCCEFEIIALRSGCLFEK